MFNNLYVRFKDTNVAYLWLGSQSPSIQGGSQGFIHLGFMVNKLAMRQPFLQSTSVFLREHHNHHTCIVLLPSMQYNLGNWQASLSAKLKENTKDSFAENVERGEF